MLPSFEEIYKKVQECSSENALHEDEALCIYNYTSKIGKNRQIVELGIEWGRSTTIFAEVAAANSLKHYAIDNFCQEYGQEYRKFQYDRKMKYAWKNTEIKEMDSARAANYFGKRVSLLFIDADHEYESVKRDAEAWLPQVKLGGIIMFHDYGRDSLPGVFKAANELVSKGLIKQIESVHWLGVFEKL
jgi:predicted O-methyltransferase YrrM